MKMTFTATALAAVLVQPASATTFPALTTIYVAAGVYDDGSVSNTGVACCRCPVQISAISLRSISRTA